MEENWQNRIERKLDQITEVMVSLAKLDEKMMVMFKNVNGLEEDHKYMDKRVAEIETILVKRSVLHSILDRTAWIAATAAIVAFFTNWFKSPGA